MSRIGLTGAAALAGCVLLAAPGAWAQGCSAMLEQFAADHGLTTSPPPTAAPSAPDSAGSSAMTESGGGAVTPDRLAQSGGLVAPPAVGDRGVIEPPATGSNMPTAPAVRPDASAGPDRAPQAGGTGATGATMGQAARNAQVESLVTAARSAARNGEEDRCMESLNQARRLLQSGPTGGSGG